MLSRRGCGGGKACQRIGTGLEEHRKGGRHRVGQRAGRKGVGLCAYAYKLYVEGEVFAGQRVVGIKEHVCVGDFGYGDLNGVPFIVGHVEVHAYFGCYVFWKLGAGHAEGLAFIAGAVGLVYRNVHCFCFTFVHADHSAVEPGNDLTGAGGKFERFAAFGGIEERAIGEGAFIMNADKVAALHRTHELDKKGVEKRAAR